MLNSYENKAGRPVPVTLLEHQTVRVFRGGKMIQDTTIPPGVSREDLDHMCWIGHGPGDLRMLGPTQWRYDVKPGRRPGKDA